MPAFAATSAANQKSKHRRGVHASKLQVSATTSMKWKEGESKREEKLKAETVLYSPSAFHRSGAHFTTR
jgi:hypothetical protein